MSLTSFFTDTEILLISSAVAFVAGVVLSQRVKDAIKGVPSEVRSALSSAETNTLSAIKQAQTDALAKLLPSAAKPAAVAPLAPAPAAAPLAPVEVTGPAPAPVVQQ